MARAGIVFGLLLCGVTFLGLVGTPIKSPTQFFPMMLGIPILFCGVVSLNPHRRKIAMHVAAAIALLGAITGSVGALYGALELMSGVDVDRYALKLVIAMSVICAVFLAVCVASFVHTRRKTAGLSNAGPTLNLHRPDAGDAAAQDVKSRESA